MNCESPQTLSNTLRARKTHENTLRATDTFNTPARPVRELRRSRGSGRGPEQPVGTTCRSIFGAVTLLETVDNLKYSYKNV